MALAAATATTSTPIAPTMSSPPPPKESAFGAPRAPLQGRRDVLDWRRQRRWPSLAPVALYAATNADTGVRWGGTGGAARRTSGSFWRLDLPPRAGIAAPYLPCTTYTHGRRGIRYGKARKRRRWVGTGEPLVRKSRTCEAKENLRGVWLDSQAAPGADPGLILMPMTPAERRGHYLGADLALAPSRECHLQPDVILQNPGVKVKPRISSTIRPA